MDPRAPGGMLLAPASSTAAALRAPGRDEPLPPVDATTLKEDSGREIVNGYVVEVMSADEPHATTQSQIAMVFGPCLKDGYKLAVEMLTRTDHRNEFAPDVSVFPKERDPATGGRKIEELAFEVIDTTRLAEVTDKAQKLVTRGVRRVFVVDVNAHTVSEWSAAQGAWAPLAARASIKDRCLAAPVPIKALLDAAEAEWAIVRGMLARKAPALVHELARSKADGVVEGKAEGRAEDIVRICALRGIPLSAEQEARVRGCRELAVLERWLEGAVTAAKGDEVLGEGAGR